MRTMFEFVKINRLSLPGEFLNTLEEIVPDIDNYKSIFNYILNELPPNKVNYFQYNRQILSEWIKFALQLNVEDEDIKNAIVSLMFDFAGQLQHSFVDYKHLLKGNKLIIDHDGNIKD